MVHDPRPAAEGTERVPGLSLKEPLSLVKFQILQDRLQLNPSETLAWLESMHQEVARQLGLPAVAVAFDAEFHGRDLDLTFTLDRQNLPPARKIP